MKTKETLMIVKDLQARIKWLHFVYEEKKRLENLYFNIGSIRKTVESEIGKVYEDTQDHKRA